jgi:hypothetical protein
LTKGACVVLMRHGKDVCFVYIGDSTGSQDELAGHGTIAAAVADDAIPFIAAHHSSSDTARTECTIAMCQRATARGSRVNEPFVDRDGLGETPGRLSEVPTNPI